MPIANGFFDGFFTWNAASIAAFFAGIAGLAVLFTAAAKAYAVIASANQKRRQQEIVFQQDQDAAKFDRENHRAQTEAEAEAECEEALEHGLRGMIRKQDKKITEQDKKIELLQTDIIECRVERAKLSERIVHLEARVIHCERTHLADSKVRRYLERQANQQPDDGSLNQGD
jgi:uncharacterized membrane protein YhiD involved in acid resistance